MNVVDIVLVTLFLLAAFAVPILSIMGVFPKKPSAKRDEAQEARQRPKWPGRPTKPASGIFISYRREDEPNFTGRLADKLIAQFGRDRVFVDIDSIELGLDFEEVINRSLGLCQVFIAVIGKNWLTVTDSRGRPRLDNPRDYVRMEIEFALRRDIRVIPVLVEGASVPDSTQLPPTMHALARRNGIEVSYSRFGSDTDRLVDTLGRILKAG